MNPLQKRNFPREVCLACLAAVLSCTAPARAQEPIAEPPVAAAVDVRPWHGWARAEYLLWRVKNDEAPYPLLTTGPAGSPKQGVLGESTTSILFADQIDYRLNSGGRFSFGYWRDAEETVGVEFCGFGLETHTRHFGLDADRSGFPVIARPFFNLQTGQPDAQVITSQQDPGGGQHFGGIDIFGDSRTWGGEANGLLLIAERPGCSWHALAGLRYLGQKDQLRFSQSSTILVNGSMGFGGSPAPAPDIVSGLDYYETNNDFFGAQVGGEATIRRGRWSLDVRTTIALGATDQRQEIQGHTLLTDSTGFTQYISGGLYATPDIVGHFDRWRVAWASEATVRVGFAVTRRCQLDLGYTFLYWDGVVRPAQQLPLGVDPRQVPSNLAYQGPQPATSPPYRSSDFWAQGLSWGLKLRF